MSTQATTPDRLTKAVMNLPRRDARDKLQNGLAKLDESREQVEEMSVELEEKKKIVFF